MQGAVTKVTINKDYRCFKEGEIFTFDPHVTLLVGDQGSGKSTLLKAMHGMQDWLNIELSLQCLSEGCKTYFFDTEKMNPRSKGDLSDINNSDVYVQHVASHFQSHGEVIRAFVLKPLQKSKNEEAVLFLDEPESGLSVRSQYEIVKEIKKQKNKQFIIATHSIVFMEAFKKVLSLEHRQWMDTKQFLNTQK